MEFPGADDFGPMDEFNGSGSMFSMPNDLAQSQAHSQTWLTMPPHHALYQQHDLQSQPLSHPHLLPQMPPSPQETQLVRRESSSQSNSSQHSPRNTQTGSSASQHQPELKETYFGYIKTTKDALHLIEACLQGKLHHVARRPHDKERDMLIRSGSIFVYEEGSAGIKRWTDGMNWSPSRILGNFLVYRELTKPFPPGEKKKAKKVPKKASAMTNGLTNGDQRGLPGQHADPAVDDSHLREFVGSLVDSYEFKERGLVKKTISVAYGGVQHHIVSYYNLADVTSCKLKRVIDDEMLMNCYPRPELIDGQNYRNPVADELNEGHPTFAPVSLAPGFIPQMPLQDPNAHIFQNYHAMGNPSPMAMLHHGLPAANFMAPAHHQGLQEQELEHGLPYSAHNDSRTHPHHMAMIPNGGRFTPQEMPFSPEGVYSGSWQYS